MIASARQSGKQITFDTDDLIFKPQLTAWHRGVANLSADEQVLYQDGVQRYLATLEASDYAVTAAVRSWRSLRERRTSLLLSIAMQLAMKCNN